MTTVELSDSQGRVMTALVNMFQRFEAPVKAERIAETLGHGPGTVRNQMHQLSSMDLVEGKPGPKGGYRPTERGFAAVDREPVDDRETVTLSGNYDRIEVTVDRITFPVVSHPETCTARVHFQQSVDRIDVGDPLAVGPTPQVSLVVLGEVEVINELADELTLRVAKLRAPLTDESP